jgi:hypothetical protein
MNCPQCGANVKTVPAGISKTTGKHYDEFQACEAKCGWRPGGFAKRPLPVAPVSHNNGECKSETMIMSYAKDLAIAQLKEGQSIGAISKEVIAIYRELLQEIKQPNSVKIND